MRTMRRRSAPAVEIPEGVEYRATATFSLRAAAEGTDGTFEGIACPADVRDAYGTTFAPGAWTGGGLDLGEAAYALLHMHDPYLPVGVFTAREADDGLMIRGAWDDTSTGRDARARAKSGSMPELSVGFKVVAVDPDDEDRFTQVRLVEVSQITARMAAVPGAKITSSRMRAEEERRASGLLVARARLAVARVR